MKFKVGDIVKGTNEKEYGITNTSMIKGEIVDINRYGRIAIKVIEHLKNEGVGYVFNLLKPKYFELVEETPKNLIPQIAKMLGVEIGEEFNIKGWSSFKHKFENGTLMSRTNENLYEEAEYETWVHLIKGNYQDIVKLPQKPKLTEAERVILEELFKEYTKIIRIETTELWVYNHSKEWKELTALSHLFQFIKEDREEYDIEELLKGE